MTNNAAVIEEYEAILARLTENGKDYWEVSSKEANRTMFYAYSIMKETGNIRLDFNEVIWDYDIQPIADTFRRNGVKEFTIRAW